MATKTYLELVNDVLVRLREDTVLAVTANSYSSLVGKWVNDAKRMVEDAWDWQALQAQVAVSIVAPTTSYTLTGVNERARLMRNSYNPNIPLAFDITTNDKFQLLDAPLDWVREQLLLQNIPASQAKPIYFATTKLAGGVGIRLFETPTTSRSWALYFVVPQDDLALDADILSVPYSPVIHIALDNALNERGEEIGEPGTTVSERAHMHIANAIAIDAQDQNRTTFYPD